MKPRGDSVFVVRAVQGGRGEVHGVIERVSTGVKETFTGVDAIGRVIAGMLAREEARFSVDPRQALDLYREDAKR